MSLYTEGGKLLWERLCGRFCKLYWPHTFTDVRYKGLISTSCLYTLCNKCQGSEILQVLNWFQLCAFTSWLYVSKVICTALVRLEVQMKQMFLLFVRELLFVDMVWRVHMQMWFLFYFMCKPYTICTCLVSWIIKLAFTKYKLVYETLKGLFSFCAFFGMISRIPRLQCWITLPFACIQEVTDHNAEM